MISEAMTYAEVEQYILDIPKFTRKNHFPETEGFYEFLRRPGEKCSVIHVAGTNGKGSVCAYTEQILLQSNHTCGLFTSPHLVCMRERIRIGQDNISEDEFCSKFIFVMRKAAEYKSGYHPTFFELLFFIAMLWFEEKQPEYLILETGLGGRLDTTNVVRNKKLCVITKIAYDHMEYLGDTLEKIASEKAGIFEAGVPAVCLDTSANITAVFRQKARAKNVTLFLLNSKEIINVKNHQKFIDFSIQSQYYEYCSVSLSTCALYQTVNASLAILALHIFLGEEMKIDAVKRALLHTKWPCRMEEIAPGIIIDGAHNRDGISAFLESVRELPGNRILLFAVVKDKEYQEMISLLTKEELFEKYIITTAGGERAADLMTIRDLFKQNTKQEVSAIADTKAAFAYAKQCKQDSTLLIAGSLYLAGNIRGLCEEENN